jgi:hypothetical protein
MGCPGGETDFIDELPALQITDVDDYLAGLQTLPLPIAYYSRDKGELDTHAEAFGYMPDLQSQILSGWPTAVY